MTTMVKSIRGNVIVVGHSMGGLVAKYAAEQVVVNTDKKKKKKKKKNRRIEHVHVTTLQRRTRTIPERLPSSFVNHAAGGKEHQKRRAKGRSRRYR